MRPGRLFCLCTIFIFPRPSFLVVFICRFRFLSLSFYCPRSLLSQPYRHQGRRRRSAGQLTRRQPPLPRMEIMGLCQFLGAHSVHLEADCAARNCEILMPPHPARAGWWLNTACMLAESFNCPKLSSLSSHPHIWILSKVQHSAFEEHAQDTTQQQEYKKAVASELVKYIIYICEGEVRRSNN